MAAAGQLLQVFQACDRGSKGYLTSEDIQVACAGLLAEQDKRKIEDIFRLDGGRGLDFATFTARVGKYFFGLPDEIGAEKITPSPEASTPKSTAAAMVSAGNESSLEVARSPEISTPDTTAAVRISSFSSQQREDEEEASRTVSPLLKADKKHQLNMAKERSHCGSGDEGSSCLSPFTPMLNSSSFLTDIRKSQQQQQQQLAVATAAATTTVNSSVNSTGPRSSLLYRPSAGLSINRTEDIFEASGDERIAPVPSKLRKRSFRDYSRVSRKIRKRGNESMSCSSAETSPIHSSTGLHSDRVTVKMEELTKKLEEVKDATAKSKMEISSLFDHFLNKSAERTEDEYIQQEKRRKIDELVRMETDLLRLKLETQLQENEKLRTQNRDIWDRLQDIEKEKQETTERLTRQKSFSCGLEEKLHQIRLENRELTHQLESSRQDMKNLEEHLIYLEERRNKDLAEFEENKKLFEAEKSRMRKDKMRMIEERDRLSSRQAELNNEQEEIQAERRLIQMDSDRLRIEREQFFTMKSSFEAKKNEDDFVLIEASSEFTNLLTENEILKASLDQLAVEKASLAAQLRAAQDQAAIRAQVESQAAASFKLERMQEEQRRLVARNKEQELVISSLMEVVEKSRKVDSGRRCFLDHQAELTEQTRRMAQLVRSLDASVSGARELLLEFCPAKSRGHSKDDIIVLKKKIAGLEQEVQKLTEEKCQLVNYVDVLVKKCQEQSGRRRS